MNSFLGSLTSAKLKEKGSVLYLKPSISSLMVGSDPGLFNTYSGMLYRSFFASVKVSLAVIELTMSKLNDN